MVDDILDQVRILLDREEKYAREDYIGCFLDDSNLPVIPWEDAAGPENPQGGLISSYTRRCKQSKTWTNSSVNSKESRKSFFSEQHRARLCEWATEGM